MAHESCLAKIEGRRGKEGSTRRLGVAGAACLMLVGSVAVLAQGPAPGQPTFTGGTTQIEVSAVVTTGGRVVTDLRRDEVQVLDNGVSQPLVAFEYVDLTAVTGPPPRRDFVLVLDDLQIDPRTTKPAQDVALALVDLLGANDRVAIVNTNPHELRQQFSTDRVQARALVRKLRGQQGAGLAGELDGLVGLPRVPGPCLGSGVHHHGGNRRGG